MIFLDNKNAEFVNKYALDNLKITIKLIDEPDSNEAINLKCTIKNKKMTKPDQYKTVDLKNIVFKNKMYEFTVPEMDRTVDNIAIISISLFKDSLQISIPKSLKF